MAIEKCPDCNYPGNGKCSDCHGTGHEQDVLDAFAESLAGTSQDCKTCHGSGDCQKCDGKGYIHDDE